MQQSEYTNNLILETSRYLQQHAHNPVNWYPWGEKALSRAKNENKLLLISIGYSACHWCHVMEHESFEDMDVARLMNEHFVCIKVDREERPDIDHIYMTAVQLMTGQGGWPLNCIALPDGRPVWGGTYFPKKAWEEALVAISRFTHDNQQKTEEYAQLLHQGIVQSELSAISNEPAEINPQLFAEVIRKWKNSFDTVNGGTTGAPKFMLPGNWQFLLRAGYDFQDYNLLNQVNLTLTKMAMGGLYDQAGGGFARYSTDEKWKVPHFEKMLYDNAQLLQLYAGAWKVSPNPLCKQVIAETVSFLKREMLSPENGFYSSLDADSEGVEGKFYTWTREELHIIPENDFDLFAHYFNVNSSGFWENNQYILLRTEDDFLFAEKYGLPVADLQAKVELWKQILLNARQARTRPGLDDKILTSWNALAITGLVSCYQALGNIDYLHLALSNASFLNEKMQQSPGKLFHSYQNGQAKIPAFLEDYALITEAFIALFETTGQKNWLEQALEFATTALNEFYDHQNSVFYFTGKQQENLISRTVELHDNVIPSSNSVMAMNLFKLAWLLDRPDFLETARQMTGRISDNILQYPSGYSNWLQLLMNQSGDHFEVVITGPDALKKLAEMQKHYLPHVVFCAATEDSGLPLLKNRFSGDRTLIYVCQNRSCRLPVESVDEALSILLKRS